MISRRASCDNFGISEIISDRLMLGKYPVKGLASTFW